jgi:DNA-binding MarR family transcriptional regulator
MTKLAMDMTYPLGGALDFLQVLWRLDRAFERLSSQMERRLGVTAQQRLVIRCIGKFPGMTAAQLAALLHVDPGTMSATLKRLEERGLIERRRDPRDKRRLMLGLSPLGRTLDRPADHTVEHAVELWLRSTTPSDVQATQVQLATLIAFIEAEHDEADSPEPEPASPPPRRRRRTAP